MNCDIQMIGHTSDLMVRMSLVIERIIDLQHKGDNVKIFAEIKTSYTDSEKNHTNFSGLCTQTSGLSFEWLVTS